MSLAIEGFGTTLAVATGGITTFPLEIIKLTTPKIKMTSVEVSNFASNAGTTDGWKEFMQGMADAGEVTFTLNHVNSDIVALFALCRSSSITTLTVTFTDATTWTCGAFLMELGEEVPLDDKITIDVTFKLTGTPTVV